MFSHVLLLVQKKSLKLITLQKLIHPSCFHGADPRYISGQLIIDVCLLEPVFKIEIKCFKSAINIRIKFLQV